jgi:parvulin-like peptidyl-prolyl isomerase
MAQEIDNSLLTRIAEALERLAPAGAPRPELRGYSAFVWHASPPQLEAVPRVNRVDLSLLRGIDLTRDILIENTERFARGLPANNVLLWGARGMGKSSLVKAAHADVNRMPGVAPAKLIEIQERPDSMKGSQILLAFAGTGNDNIKRTKAEAKTKIDSLMNVLKKNPLLFAEAAKKYSDYPTAKDDGGDLTHAGPGR